VTCYDRANSVLKAVPALALSAFATSNRAICLFAGLLDVLATSPFWTPLKPPSAWSCRDLRRAAIPPPWALLQVHLARLYEARMDITGVLIRESAPPLLQPYLQPLMSFLSKACAL
jgi:hypothetical protein